MKVIFRTHGGKNVGLGHVSRCLSLAQAMKEKAEILFIVNDEISDYVIERGFDVITNESFDTLDFQLFEDSSPDLIILDSYDITSDYVRLLRKRYITILFDDNAEHNPITSHFLVNGNIHAKSLKYEGSFNDVVYLLGPEYLIMKPEYWEETHSFSTGSGIMLTTGGADFHLLMPRFMKALKDLDLSKRVIIGPMYSEREIEEIEKIDGDFELIYHPKSLKRYIENSKLVITACGSTVYEVLRLRRIPVVYTLAENQKLIARSLEGYGVKNLGDWRNIKWNELIDIIRKEYIRDPTDFEELFDLFDGRGVFRLMESIGI